MNANWMKNVQNMGKISLMPTVKYKFHSINFYKTQQHHEEIYAGFCPDCTWNTGYYRQKFTYPPRVKYDNCCMDFQESHIWQLFENKTYPEFHKNLTDKGHRNCLYNMTARVEVITRMPNDN